MFEYIQGMYKAFFKRLFFLIPPNTPVAKDSDLKFLENVAQISTLKCRSSILSTSKRQHFHSVLKLYQIP